MVMKYIQKRCETCESCGYDTDTVICHKHLSTDLTPCNDWFPRQKRVKGIMTPKEYLLRYRNFGQSIDAKRMQIQRLREQATQITQAVNPDKVQSSGEPDRVSAVVGQIIDAVQDLEKQIVERETARKEIEAAISGVEDNDQRVLLEYRYLAGLTWEEIAVQMHYSYQWVCVLHGRALQQLIVIDTPPVL